ncbi:MAG: nuclear transport factor 2 family protein [Rhizobiaceae bacterium]|nr:nuclear transport factor 2 family protein [Rhizobiaceae bacterium]
MGFTHPTSHEIAARDCLQRLVNSYSRACDRRDFALLRSLYHDDAIEEHGDMFTGSADEYVEWVETALSNWSATAHYVANALFEVRGDRAEGEIYKINYHRTLDGAEEIVTGSRSLDGYERRGGEWRFLRRTVTLDWAEQRPANDRTIENFAAASPPGEAGPEDLSYTKLTLFGRTPIRPTF